MNTQLPAGFGFLAVVIMLVQIAVHVVFAFGVHNDAAARRTVLAPAIVWTLATLMTGVVGGALYWLVHHSSLVTDGPEA